MQKQIQAIKQLLEINNITASQIEEIFVKALGDRASWENSSTYTELAYLEDTFEKDEGEIPLETRWIFELLWRSRIDLNDARINAEEVDLDSFLTHIAVGNDFNLVEANITLRKEIEDRDRTISVLDTKVDSLRMDVKERDQRVSLLKTQTKGFEAALELAANSKAIAPNLDAFKGAVDEAVNPALLEKIEELRGVIDQNKEAFAKELRTSLDLIAERDRQIQELQITVKNHREQFENLKSHFEVLLKAIAMNLNSLKGARKPDEIKEVDGVMVTFRNYDDNLTHHHKTIIVENLQRAIAEEAKKLKAQNLKDFSFDEIPF